MERYHRNIIAESFSETKQQKLIDSRVLVIGAGGLGSAVLQYLTAAGIGHIGIVEYDEVSITNLQRQVLYTENDLGKHKGECAKKRLMSLNSKLDCTVYNLKLNEQNGIDIVKGYDIIVDCTDNYEARYTIDTLSINSKIPFVYGSAEQMGGQISTFNYMNCGSYRNLFPESQPSKSGVGVLSPLPGIVGSLQALEVIKILTGMNNNLAGKLLLIDTENYSTTIFSLR